MGIDWALITPAMTRDIGALHQLAELQCRPPLSPPHPSQPAARHACRQRPKTAPVPPPADTAPSGTRVDLRVIEHARAHMPTSESAPADTAPSAPPGTATDVTDTRHAPRRTRRRRRRGGASERQAAPASDAASFGFESCPSATPQPPVATAMAHMNITSDASQHAGSSSPCGDAR